jgi:signal transduction histidine kinase
MAGRQEAIPEIAVRATIDLGFDGAAFRVLKQDSVEHRVLEAAGIDEEPADATSLSAAMTDAVLERGGTVVAGGPTGVVPLPVSTGEIEAAVACPIWVQGWVSAVLVGVVAREGRLAELEIEAMELLASQAGLTLASGLRSELERGVTASIEEGDRLKNEFLTTISHEMRTPLTVLLGNGRTLEHGWDSLDETSRRNLLAAMNANVRVLDRMVTDLLDYSRLEAGELWVSFEPFDLSRILDRLCEGAVAALGRRRLETDIEPGLLASGDVVLIRRTVSNLLGNAAAHTPEGTTVTVSCRRVGEQVEISVADDGPGIAERDLPYLGERFFRGGVATARPKGLGLGLALARGILDLHQSPLLIANDPGHGVRFSFSLPYVPDPARQPSDDDDHAHGATAYAPRHGRS